MGERIRKSGIDIIDDVPWGTHFCQFYQTKEDLIDILVPYFKAGLKNNEFCIWITSQPLDREEAKKALREAVPDFDYYLEKGQIEIIHYADWYLKSGVFDSQRVLNGWAEKLNQALADGYDGLRLSENTFWMEKTDWDNFVDYEKKADAVISNYHMIALCTYSLDAHDVTEAIDIVANHQFTLVKKEGKWERIENSGRKNINNRKRAEETLRQSEQRTRLKLKSILSPARKTANLEFSDIIDAQAIQSLMDDFYKLAHIPIGIIDIKGNVLVGVGWQDICTKFHRVHPEACKHCVESDTKLSTGVLPGEFKMYRCKNNMWDIVTPIIVGGQHLGNIFLGQFFFEEEPLDYELFRSQAGKYGFNEEEYIAALEKVPRLSRKAADTIMSFFMKLANMLSQLSYSNIKFAQSLAERDALVDALRESKEKYRNLVETANEGIWIIDNEDKTIYVNKKMTEMLGYGQEEMIGRSGWDFTDEEDKAVSRLNMEKRQQGIDESHEFKFRRKDGSPLWTLVNTKSFFDKDGKFTGSMGMLTDITKRKEVEEALIKRENEFRTLAENSPDVIARFDRQNRHIYANPAVVECYGRSPEELIGKTHSELGMDPEQVKFWEEHHQKVFATGKTETMEFQYLSPQGKKYYFNTRIVPEFVGGEVTSVLAISRDITDIKEAEARLKETLDNLEKLVEERTSQLEETYNSLKESEKRLAEAQRMAHIGNWEWDIATGETHWSQEMCRIFGCNPQEIVPAYNELLNYVHPGDRDYVANAVKKGLKGEQIVIDFRVILADGEERTIHIQTETIFDEMNIPVRVKGTVQDITEFRKAEEKIQSLANIVESSNDAIITESLDGIITSWNRGAEQVYGYSAEEILGKPISILEPGILVEETKKLAELVKQGEKVQQYETLRLRKDGTKINVSMTLSPVFDIDGKLTAISVIYRDITKRKEAEEKLLESEEKYRNIVETANEGIYIIDDEGIITYVNKKMTDMLGYNPEEGIGRSIWDFISEEDKNIVKQNMEKRRQGINESYELKLICKDGSFLWALVNAKSLFDKDGKFMGTMSMLTDITERKKTEKAMANLEIARKKEIHHRIKNNLQVISSLLDLQAEKFNNRECVKDSEILTAFRESQDRVISMALIHEELYKGEGTDTLDFSTYLRKLAENLFQTYRYSDKNIHLSMDLEENALFNMDTAVPLGIIVNELVSNSLKHAFPGRNRGEIRIKLRREENGEHKKEGNKSTSFTLTVSDNGVGIPEKPDLENPDSLGIQLITTLVDQLDGKLQLKRNNGTEFAIRFTVTEKQ